MSPKLSLNTSKYMNDILAAGYWAGMHGLPYPSLLSHHILGMAVKMDNYNKLLAQFNAAVEINNRDLADIKYVGLIELTPHTSIMRSMLKAQLKTVSNINKRYLT